MKPNTENVSLPFGKYGEIRLVRTRENRSEEDGSTRTVVKISAKGLSFNGENFDILQTKLCTLYGFQNVVVEPDDEDVAINIAFDCKVEGRVRNPRGLLRSMRKKLQYAMGQSYRCLHCFDRATENCPECRKRKEMQALGDYLDRKGEFADEEPDFYMEGDERIYEGKEAREYCDQCGEPWDECVCPLNDLDSGICFQCGHPEKECICV